MNNLKIFTLKDQQMAVNSTTVLKVLGKPPIDWTDIIIRESIQNSLDASDFKKNKEIEFKIYLHIYENVLDIEEKIQYLKQNENDQIFKRLVSRIKNSDPTLLIFRDSGTTGLSGPINRIDSNWNNKDKRRNFDNLVYQLGINHGTTGAGGSYGFGKSSYYQISEVGLVMYYTNCIEGQRLAFSLISNREKESDYNSTGISWWGDTYTFNGIEYASPIIDEDLISKILKKLEIEKIKYNDDEFGTTICIFSPKLTKLINNDIDILDDRLDEDKKNEQIDYSELTEQVLERLKESIIKWYWPRVFKTNENSLNGSIKPLIVYLNDVEVTLPIQFKKMGELLSIAEKNNNESINDNKNIKVESINHKFGNVKIGSLVYEIINSGFNIENKFSILNKIAMIRAPRMVVYYQELQARKENSISGVFLVNSKVDVKASSKDKHYQKLDNAFRDCESATHSEWNYQVFDEEKKWFRAYVRKVKEEVIRIITTSLNNSKSESISKPLTKIAKNLGNIFNSESSGGISLFKSNPPKERKRNSKEKFISINNINIEFLEKNKIQADIFFENVKNHLEYKLEVLAKGGSYELNSIEWEKEIGDLFPFQITKYSSFDLNILDIRDNNSSIFFRNDTHESKLKSIRLEIEISKNDVLFSFKIN